MQNKLFIILAALVILAVGAVLIFRNNEVAPLPSLTDTGLNRDIFLYYYNPDADKDAAGNILCSRAGLVPVTRSISSTTTPIQDAVRLLLKGGITESEKAAGITTEFPLPALEFVGADLDSGVLTLEFLDPNSATSGGSCRAVILWYQIEATAKQFAGINDVRYLPGTLFQP